MIMTEEILNTTSSFCLKCKKPMKFNVPRLGPKAGCVHVDTGQFDCGPKKELRVSYETIDKAWRKAYKEVFGDK